jgi:formylglycine-generating enzyme required for sulfatase activity
MKRNAIAWVMILVALGLSGCGKDSSTVSEPVGIQETTETIGGGGGPTGQIAFNVRYMYPSGRLAKTVVVDRMTAYVYELGGTESIAQADLEKVGDRGKASITVSAGDDRVVELVAYDGELVSWTGSDHDVDVMAGDTTTADITMTKFAPILQELTSPDVDGNYMISWIGLQEVGYTLEEGVDQAFSSPETIYAGSDTSKAIVGKTDGTYWYRAKARGKYGEGKWSEVVSLTVELPPGEGTIDVDVPWPMEQEMALIPAGSFQMGDHFNEGEDCELPVHTVRLDAFYMDIFEVTNRQYRAYAPSHDSGSYEGQSLNGDHQPVVYVSWWDAIKYCNWRSRQEGLEECYDESMGGCDFSKSGYRLPTEAEWEYAARGGLEGKRYPWGDHVSHDEANYHGTGGRDQWNVTSPVGCFPANGYGLYDMAGNVWEWCYDWSDCAYYGRGPESNPHGPETGGSRVVRGDAWYGDPSGAFLRCAFRNNHPPPDHTEYVGFRCVRRAPSVMPSRQTGDTATFDLPGGATIEMVWIEPGTFIMGTTEEQKQAMISEGWEDDFERELPAHEVTITRGFWLGKYELTQGQWESVMGTTPWSGRDYVQERASNPAAWISWEDVQAFIGVLNEMEGSEVYRLPTEAQWEYACRAGSTTRWSFGDDESMLGEYAWYDANAWNVGEKYAHEVGAKLPNPWGLHDMHGNVWEWCWDWYGTYSSGAQVDPMGPSSGSYRVVRCGDFGYYAWSTRSANRSYLTPGFHIYHVGARLVRQEPQ